MFRRCLNLKNKEREMSFNFAVGCVIVIALALGTFGLYLSRKNP